MREELDRYCQSSWPAIASECVRCCWDVFNYYSGERRPPLHFTGMPSVDANQTVESLLDKMGFVVVPKGVENSIVAKG